MPAEAIERVRRLEWGNRAAFRERVAGEREWPIRIGLHPPTGPQAAGDLGRAQTWVSAWRAYPRQHQVAWEKQTLRGAGEVEIPIFLALSGFDDLASVLDRQAELTLRRAIDVVRLFTAIDDRLAQPVKRDLWRLLEEVPPADLPELAAAVAQLNPAMGQGRYLRALPLEGVGTKLVETYRSLLTRMLTALHDPPPADADALYSWLDVRPPPAPTILIRPLCPTVQVRLLGAPVLWVSGRDLSGLDLPGQRLLIIENAQSGLAMPPVPGGLCIAGAGNELDWLAADWTARFRIAYWGDIDSHGFSCLEHARRYHPAVPALLMDDATFDQHRALCSREDSVYVGELGGRLNVPERVMLERLRQAPPDANRLEQEKLHTEWIASAINAWIRETQLVVES